MQYATVDIDAIRDITWDWSEFATDRATTIASATLHPDIPGNVEFIGSPTPDVDVPTHLVSIRVKISAPVAITCRAVFENGESQDWTFKFDTEEH